VWFVAFACCGIVLAACSRSCRRSVPSSGFGACFRHSSCRQEIWLLCLVRQMSKIIGGVHESDTLCWRHTSCCSTHAHASAFVTSASSAACNDCRCLSSDGYLVRRLCSWRSTPAECSAGVSLAAMQLCCGNPCKEPATPRACLQEASNFLMAGGAGGTADAV
jgi:hypothetical protein